MKLLFCKLLTIIQYLVLGLLFIVGVGLVITYCQLVRLENWLKRKNKD